MTLRFCCMTLRSRVRLTVTHHRCGPCKVFKPTFVAAAKEHAGRALFLSCMGDSNASTAKIMKRLAIKCAVAPQRAQTTHAHPAESHR
jgi:hypothetical protein